MDKLTQQFVEAINQVSYHNAGEGEMYWRERDAARKAEQRLAELKTEMLAVHGRAKTLEVIQATPHLCFTELELPKEEGAQQ